MTDNHPLEQFAEDLAAGVKLCLLPLGRVLVEEPLWVMEKLFVYPPNSLGPAGFNILTVPAAARDAALGDGSEPPHWREFSGTELHWLKSATTGITLDDVFGQALIALPIRLDWNALITPASHEAHLDMIRSAAAEAEAALDRVRFDYCRLDLPDTLPGRAAYILERGFSAALFYDGQTRSSHIVAGQIATHAVVKGIGLDMTSVSPMAPLGAGEAGNIARHGLRLFTSALEAGDDTAKFIQLMTLVDYLADPDAFISMQDAKKLVALHVARDQREYDEILADFRFLTSDANTPNRGLRHNIVHLGRRLEELVDKPQRDEVLRRVSRYVGMTLRDIMELSDGAWSDVVALRERRSVELGLRR